MKDRSKKGRTAEPSGRTSHQLQDKGYKKLFANKEMFLEFLQTFVNEEWVRDINEEDLIRIDKEFVLQDYRKKEADIVYKMKLKNCITEEENEVIFYILLELQSSVDRMMPYRLLMYMVQIWKQELSNVKYDEAQDKDYKLPSIVPIVLYNGSKEWDAVMEFKNLLNEPGRFGDYLVNFRYILVDTDSYSEESLLKVSNTISYIIMMDQSIVAKDKDVMIRRLNGIVKIKDKLPVEKLELLIEWLKEVLSTKFPEEEAKKIIESLKEGKDMTYNIERLFENVEQMGELKKALETARMGLSEGLSVELIRKLTGLDIEKIKEIEKEIKH